MNKSDIYNDFLKGIIFWGRITLILALVMSFIPAAYLYFMHGIMPTWGQIVAIMGKLFTILIVSWIVEPIAYFPIVGTSGTYMSWLAGNISNMRVPVSAIAQQAAEVQEGTPEGDIISTLGIGVSVLIKLIILAFAAVFGVQIIAALPPAITQAFNYILPAVFGAVLANFALRNLKLGAFALAMAFILGKLGTPTWLQLLVCVFGTICMGVVFFNMEEKKKNAAQ